MRCNKPYINAVSTLAQTSVVGGALTFNHIVVEGTCVGFIPGTSTFVLPAKGVYEVSFDTDVIGAGALPMTISVVNNGTVVLGAIATNTMAEGETLHFHVQGVVNVKKSCECIDNTAHIQITTSAIGNVQNANIVIHKIA